MTLFEKVKQISSNDVTLIFTQFGFNLVVKLEVIQDGIVHSKESWLPTNDHFYESKVVDCISFMVEEIKKEIAQQTKHDTQA